MYSSFDTLPDITNQLHSTTASPLKWVGMEKIGLPVQFAMADGTVVSVTAQIDVFVSLDTAAKGIHMSRLYLQLDEKLANQLVTPKRLNELLDAVLASHHGISESAKITLTFDLPLAKKALLSDNMGHQVYPVTLNYEMLAGVPKTSMAVTLPYSSTCPCSASLANQLNADAIAQQFDGDKIDKHALLQWLTNKETALATPHNQRSYAYVDLVLSDGHWEALDSLVFRLEAAIGTPVQTAVKREDEQEFARLNGRNLMFCEDAARRLKLFLESLNYVVDYRFKVEHQESLHAHNAVVIDHK